MKLINRRFSVLFFSVLKLSLSSENSAISSEDVKMLLRLARENRQFLGNEVNNFNKSYNFYNQVINNGKGADLSDAYFELSELLESNSASYLSITNNVKAFDYLITSAELGNAKAQHSLSAAYATGVHTGLVSMDAGLSLFLEYMSALSGNPEANMGMGFRYLNGIGVSESCPMALKHYEYAANKVAETVERRGYSLYSDMGRVSDGEQFKSRSKGGEFTPELIAYYTNLAEEGDVGALSALSSLYLEGSRSVPQDRPRAERLLRKAAERDSPAAAGLLGYLLARKQPFTSPSVAQEAERLLRFAHSRDDIIGGMGLGYLMLTNQTSGHDSSESHVKAVELIAKAAGKHADASHLMGEILSGRDLRRTWGAGWDALVDEQRELRSVHFKEDLPTAINFYAISAKFGHILSQHRLTKLQSLPCSQQVLGYRAVAEKGDWSSDMQKAHRLLEQNDCAGAVKLFSKLAAVGLEVAQFNTAQLLMRPSCKLMHLYNGSAVSVVATDLRERMDASLIPAQKHSRALLLYGWSSAQGSPQGLLRTGDLMFYGMEGRGADKAEAARLYQAAAEMRLSHACFNLGVMYQLGDGVTQDLHLAKRFFDRGGDVDPTALPARDAALLLLQGHKALYRLLGHDNFLWLQEKLMKGVTMLTRRHLPELLQWLRQQASDRGLSIDQVESWWSSVGPTEPSSWPQPQSQSLDAENMIVATLVVLWVACLYALVNRRRQPTR